ncbi:MULTISPECIES: phage protein Gp37 [Pasteurellaceae]|uniref:DUF1834 family protein n=1 Tax=Pasteurella atlantica TaxID=2827233 RepID=A0AAW8CRM5_9PAST|nr:phage protein Gp37 [Pasteurella atlantica]MBR0574075.1 DUF1834 family protein [Pasteurella atlantica]MDP8040102.1 DUF1834 family protein [Pasteurella atlantica]MDP8042215.1 DUF1834 family protein [Pasteurella atlantica]MDP8044378.1 DUF1834 family protein [Pasteurella atlantica]MDP8046374.1 DUF1834 family protein [Pasteurella atlantica]
MITKIENALIERLKKGLGKLVYSVDSYSGEIDDTQLNVRRLPLCLVSYGGSNFDTMGATSRGKRYKTSSSFVVLVLARSLRSGTASRKGGITKNEIGVNQLAQAVKYLLVNQTLNGLVDFIKPKRIRTILNNAEIRSERLSALSLEFEIKYTEQDFLEDGRFPEGEKEWETIFKTYQGQLDDPLPDLKRIGGEIFDPSLKNVKQPFVVELGEKNES